MSAKTTPEVRQERQRRVRGRNLAVLWALLGLVALFFAITIVQVARQ